MRTHTHGLSLNAHQTDCDVAESSAEDQDQLSGNDDQDIRGEGNTGEVGDDGGLCTPSEDEHEHRNKSNSKINYNSCVTSYFILVNADSSFVSCDSK